MTMKVAILALLLGASVHGFQTVPTSQRRQHSISSARHALPSLFSQRHMASAARLQALPSPEESAKALSDYMAKSHEEKLRAVREVEEKKAAEIQALKGEIDVLKQGGASSSAISMTAPSAAVEGSKEELAAKLLSYQQFMAQYIVKAQEEKVKAIKAAEEATAKKYELLLVGGAAAPPASLPSKETTLYMERNKNLSEAAKAGKSRWGDMEAHRAAEQVGVTLPSTLPSSAPVADAVNGAAAVESSAPPRSLEAIPPEVVEADHGLRADGGVGGLTLAERVVLGSSAAAGGGGAVAAPPSGAAVSRNQQLYHARNALVSAAGQAGKSRWGSMEVEKAAALAALPLEPAAAAAPPVAPEIQAADHGLHNAGTPSLAQRVNLGAQLLKVDNF